MNGSIGSRLIKLEARRTAGWRAWAGVRMEQWPDAALHSFLGHSLGIPAEAAAVLTEAELEAVVAGATAAGA